MSHRIPAASILILSLLLPSSAWAIGSRVQNTLLQAAVIGGNAKACGIATKALIQTFDRTLFHLGVGVVEQQQLKGAFRYAFNLGIQRQLAAGNKNCGSVKERLADSIAQLKALH